MMAGCAIGAAPLPPNWSPMSAYYRCSDRRVLDAAGTIAHYQPLPPAQGAWNAHEQHMAPATGVLCAELERFQPRSDLRIGRICLDILGLIPLAPFTITTRLLRPGRTIELVEATMTAAGRDCIVARAWRMQTCDTSAIAGLEDAAVPGPDQFEDWNGMQQWPGGYIQSLQCRVAPGHRHGRGLVWLSNALEMIEGEDTSAFVRLMGMVDTANGVAPRLPPGHWAFPNLDLDINLLRLPRGRWLGLQATQQYGRDGIGLTSAVLHDKHGPFGRSSQILTLRRLDG